MTKQQVIDILEAYKPSSNIYNGYNSIEEKIDERICYLIDEIIKRVKQEQDDAEGGKQMMKMTGEEVKNQLEELIKDRESFMVGDYDKDIYDRDKVALELAVKAVEKQVPKKVKREFATEGGCITCFETDVCPTCGDDFYIDDLGQTMYYSFCPDCGQALDWTDDDE